MNASLRRLSRRSHFPIPAGLHKVEICSESGLLATDKCYEDVQRRERRLVQAPHQLRRTRDRCTDADRSLRRPRRLGADATGETI